MSSNIIYFFKKNKKSFNYTIYKFNNFNLDLLDHKKGIYILDNSKECKVGSSKNLKDRLKTYSKNSQYFNNNFNFYIYETEHYINVENIILTLLSNWRTEKPQSSLNGKYFLSENINLELKKLKYLIEYIIINARYFKINFSISRSTNTIKNNLNKLIEINNDILINLLDNYISLNNYHVPIPMDIDDEYKEEKKFNINDFNYFIDNSL